MDSEQPEGLAVNVFGQKGWVSRAARSQIEAPLNFVNRVIEAQPAHNKGNGCGILRCDRSNAH